MNILPKKYKPAGNQLWQDSDLLNFHRQGTKFHILFALCDFDRRLNTLQLVQSNSEKDSAKCFSKSSFTASISPDQDVWRLEKTQSHH